jgi:hypothetical protein
MKAKAKHKNFQLIGHFSFNKLTFIDLGFKQIIVIIFMECCIV